MFDIDRGSEMAALARISGASLAPVVKDSDSLPLRERMVRAAMRCADGLLDPMFAVLVTVDMRVVSAPLTDPESPEQTP